MMMPDAARSSAVEDGQRLWPETPPPSPGCAVIASAGGLAGTVRAWRYRQPVVGLVTAGDFAYRTEHEERLCVPGLLIAGNANDAFEAQYTNSSGNRRSVVFLDQSLLDEVAAVDGHEDATFKVAMIGPGRASAAPAAWIQLLGGGQERDESTRLLLASYLLAQGRPERSRFRLSLQREARLRRAIRHIENEFDRACTLDALAEISGLTRYHFLRSFRQLLGVTPGQYVLHLRMVAAAKRLAGTSDPVTQIALDVGCNDLSHFYKMFRQRFGAPPALWRLRH